MYASANAVIENNLIFTESGNIRIGISQGDLSSPPASLKNNDIFDCNDSLYLDVDGAVDCDDAAAVNGLGAFSSGNIETTGTALDAVFITPSPPNYDWQLEATSPIEIRQGGLNLGTYFTADKNGTPRTAPWSMGAYEKD